jgi:hypothetical protein
MPTRRRLFVGLILPLAAIALSACSTGASAGQPVPVVQVHLGRYTIEPAELKLIATYFGVVAVSILCIGFLFNLVI